MGREEKVERQKRSYLISLVMNLKNQPGFGRYLEIILFPMGPFMGIFRDSALSGNLAMAVLSLEVNASARTDHLKFFPHHLGIQTSICRVCLWFVFLQGALLGRI